MVKALQQKLLNSEKRYESELFEKMETLESLETKIWAMSTQILHADMKSWEADLKAWENERMKDEYSEMKLRLCSLKLENDTF